MKPLEERLNERIERSRSGNARNGQRPSGFMLLDAKSGYDPEIDPLVAQVWRLQQTPHIQVKSDFAHRLERRVLLRNAELQLQQKHQRRFSFAFLLSRPALSAALGIVVLFCLLSTSVLAFAARVSDPTNPFYGIKLWEQQAQVSLTHNSADQATLQLQFARDQLNMLSSFASQNHAGAYRQTLDNLDTQLNNASATINSLPAGTQRTQLFASLADLKLNTIQVLHDLLPRLELSDRLATTDELARLGDTVFHLTGATLVLPAQPNGEAIISFSGTGFQSSAQLLVNGNILAVVGTLQNGQMVFVVHWNGEQHPYTLGLLNPDGTAVQTTLITIQRTSENNNPPGNGNRPAVTPTPNGNKPVATPTPHNNNKPSPTPHH